MSEATELGRSITQAIRFLREAFGDVHHLLVALDGAMAERGWQATEKNKVSYYLSNHKLYPHNWVQHYLFRWYHPAGTQGKIERLMTFEVRFDPPAPFEEPMLVMAAATFSAPTTWEALYQRWKQTTPLLEAVTTFTEPHPLKPEQFSSYLPDAIRLAAFAVPLCSLTAREELASRCVEPMFGALASLEAA